MRNAPLALASAAILMLAAVLAIAGMSTGVVNAQAASTIALDLNIAGNTSTAIPSIEQCARIDENGVQDADETGIDTLTIDVTIQGAPAFSTGADPIDPTDDIGGIIGYQFNIDYDAAIFTIDTSQASSGPAPDATFIVNRNAGSSVSDFSETTPDNNLNNTWLGTGLDIGTGIPESGDGVMHRVTISTEAGAAAGQYLLALTNHAHLDVQGTAFSPTATLVGNIAVNQACVGLLTPTPTPSPEPATPTPSPSPSPSPSPTPSPSPSPCTVNCPTASPTPAPTTAGAGSVTPASRTPTLAATPSALPPTGSTGDGGPSAPIVLGAASVLVIAMALGGYEITRRLKREA